MEKIKEWDWPGSRDVNHYYNYMLCKYPVRIGSKFVNVVGRHENNDGLTEYCDAGCANLGYLSAEIRRNIRQNFALNILTIITIGV